MEKNNIMNIGKDGVYWNVLIVLVFNIIVKINGNNWIGIIVCVNLVIMLNVLQKKV